MIHILPLLFVVINLLSAGRYPSDALIHISGHFKQTQRSAVIETAINLVTSIIFVNIAGIVGVLIGTILSSLYRTNYLIRYVNKNIIHRKNRDTYLCWCVSFLVFLFVIYTNAYVAVNLTSYMRIFTFCVPYAVVVGMLYVVVNSLCFPQAFRYVLEILKKRDI